MASGALGTALGIAGVWTIAEQLNQAVIVTLTWILLAFGFSAVTGIFFGYYPASAKPRA